MSGIIDCEMHIGDEVFVHGYIDEIRNDTIIIRNVGGYFGTSRDEVFYYEEDERGYGTMNEADRKTEPTISKMEQVDEDINVRSKDEPQTDCAEALTLLWINNMVTDEEFYRIDARLKCISCKWWNDTIAGGSECVSKECTYQPKDEPQTEDFQDWKDRKWTEAIVTEPTISKMEQVDEPQTERYCTNCKHNGVIEDYECRTCNNMNHHEFIQSQTDCAWR